MLLVSMLAKTNLIGLHKCLVPTQARKQATCNSQQRSGSALHEFHVDITPTIQSWQHLTLEIKAVRAPTQVYQATDDVWYLIYTAGYQDQIWWQHH